MISLAQALEHKNNQLKTTVYESLKDKATSRLDRVNNAIKAWWYKRRAVQIMVEDLSSLEDLYIRNTDSMIEYATFGEALSRLPTRVLARKISEVRSRDERSRAVPYYEAYVAENHLSHGRRREGLKLLESVLDKAREDFDAGLVLHGLILRLGQMEHGSPSYKALAEQIFIRSRPALRNHGFTLPARISNELASSFEDSAFYHDSSVENSIVSEYKDGGYRLLFDSPRQRIRADGATLAEAVNQLSNKVFSEDLE